MKGLRTLEPVDFFKETKKIRDDTKLNSEISNAIKRQRETVGVDYWRTTASCRVPLSRAQKRSTVEKMHDLKFDFPNGMFPVIPQAHKNHRTQVTPTVRLKKKMSCMGLNDFKRSNSDMSLSVPRISNASRILTPKRAYVTDLTCLQFADTLLSKTSVHSTSFGLSVGKTRYMNYFIEMDQVRSPKESETLPSIMNVPMMSLTNVSSEQGTNGTIKLHDTGLLDSINYVENFVVDGHEEKRSTKDGEYIGETKQRSILKSSNSAKQSLNVNKKNTVDTCNEYSNQDSERLQTVHQNYENSDSEIDRTTYVTVTSQNANNCVNCVVTGNDVKMGRSVRFSISDEIYEYTPSEPICI